MLDTYAEAAAGIARFSGKSTFKTWLFSIGKRMAISRLRRARFVPTENVEIPDESAVLPELDILREERNRELYFALMGLKEEYRQMLILLYFEQVTLDEAGQIMGKSKKQIYN